MDKMPKDKMPDCSERTHIPWNFVWFAFVRVYLLFAFCPICLYGYLSR